MMEGAQRRGKGTLYFWTGHRMWRKRPHVSLRKMRANLSSVRASGTRATDYGRGGPMKKDHYDG